MNLDNLKLFRLHKYAEHTSRENLEDMYYCCFKEFPLDDLTLEDLQFNITKYIDNCSSEEVARVFKYVF